MLFISSPDILVSKITFQGRKHRPSLFRCSISQKYSALLFLLGVWRTLPFNKLSINELTYLLIELVWNWTRGIVESDNENTMPCFGSECPRLQNKWIFVRTFFAISFVLFVWLILLMTFPFTSFIPEININWFSFSPFFIFHWSESWFLCEIQFCEWSNGMKCWSLWQLIEYFTQSSFRYELKCNVTNFWGAEIIFSFDWWMD